MTVSKCATANFQTLKLMPKRAGMNQLITLLCKPVCDLLVNGMVGVLLIAFELD
jgi:hypothetical protein